VKSSSRRQWFLPWSRPLAGEGPGVRGKQNFPARLFVNSTPLLAVPRCRRRFSCGDGLQPGYGREHVIPALTDHTKDEAGLSASFHRQEQTNSLCTDEKA
jgi:hypothetical protein